MSVNDENESLTGFMSNFCHHAFIIADTALRVWNLESAQKKQAF